MPLARSASGFRFTRKRRPPRSGRYARELLEACDRERAERLLLLGDILYHGPRNDLPEEYDPKGVIRMLNERKRDILCVRGNCDSEVDQMVQQSLSKALKYGATDRL